jgi:hypothetical protein
MFMENIQNISGEMLCAGTGFDRQQLSKSALDLCFVKLRETGGKLCRNVCCF